ncbi:hypothetical protein O1611_g10253 [Lasiodiplodia mahajangana]|uniref:Uncharacterized protein n=1 Tax=Lasiodiplodia mahajangana TaxID=1108764 RepID=A0ACC2J0A8_9PEZI|nr:hypothetical protein O1611_g10253 [Lasiodiplodia mahajangana]
MASSTSPLGSSRASWMYADPYTYQYSEIDPEDDMPAVSPNQQAIAAVSGPCELEGSTPTDTTPRYELAANPLLQAIREDHKTKSEPSSPCGLSRNRLSDARRSVRHSDRRKQGTRDVHTMPSPYYSSGIYPPQQPPIIPVAEDAPTLDVPAAPPQRQYPQPSPPLYPDGLIPVDENASTPKEPSSDFDAILRNIGPIPKKGKGNTSRERSSRYYDRYSSNFG